jgi:hypothetical protein
MWLSADVLGWSKAESNVSKGGSGTKIDQKNQVICGRVIG